MVEADVVTRNGVVGGSCADDLDAIDRIGRDDVALGCNGTAYLVAGAVLNKNADLVGLRDSTRSADADIVAGDDVVGRRKEADGSAGGEAIDDEPFYRAARGTCPVQGQCADGPRPRTIDFNNGRPRKIGLGGAIEGHRVADHGQHCSGSNGVA